MDRMPSLFVSHGAPTLALEDGPTHRFLRQYPARIPRPRAIVVLSAHWLSRAPRVGATASPDTVHDFHGFPAPLYALRYPAPGSPALAARVVELLGRAGLTAECDDTRGLDHGAWVPLMLMYPQADIAVLQVSLQPHLGPRHSIALGEALGALRDEGVLLVGSGGASHNLRALAGQPVDAPPPPWVARFVDWLHEHIGAGSREELLDYRARAPGAAQNHPTEEHLLPLFAALGAAGPHARGRRVHAAHAYGVLAMDAYEFA